MRGVGRTLGGLRSEGVSGPHGGASGLGNAVLRAMRASRAVGCIPRPGGTTASTEGGGGHFRAQYHPEGECTDVALKVMVGGPGEPLP
jgi:hypothetical protein